MVKINFLDKDGKTFRFIFENVSVEYLNAIRRMIGYDVPIYAIEDIDFYSNDSVIVDEMLANRIGLCPIITPKDNTGKKVTLSIDKEGPCTVYSKDLISLDPEIKPAYEKIPLTKLNQEEKLRLDCYAILGKGSDHIKYSPAIISYQQMSELELSKGCDGCNACVEACTKGALELVSKKPKLKYPEKCDSCQACADACPNSCLKLNDTKNYIFNIELIGQCSINTLISLFSRYLKEQISILKKKIK